MLNRIFTTIKGAKMKSKLVVLLLSGAMLFSIQSQAIQLAFGIVQSVVLVPIALTTLVYDMSQEDKNALSHAKDEALAYSNPASSGEISASLNNAFEIIQDNLKEPEDKEAFAQLSNQQKASVVASIILKSEQ